MAGNFPYQFQYQFLLSVNSKSLHVCKSLLCFVIGYLISRYPLQTEQEIAKSCPFCRGNCNCNAWLQWGGHLKVLNCNYMHSGVVNWMFLWIVESVLYFCPYVCSLLLTRKVIFLWFLILFGVSTAGLHEAYKYSWYGSLLAVLDLHVSSYTD